MTQEELEFQISQYVDGTLPPAERAALELRLQSDAEAREILAEYRNVDATLHRDLPLPAVNWDALAAHISASVTASETPEIVGRITPEIAAASTNSTASVWTWRSRLAIAASIVVVLTTGLLVVHSHQPGTTTPLRPETPTVNSTAMVIGPQAEPATGPVVQQITIGPSKALAERGEASGYAEGVVTSPSTAVIAGEMKPPSDGDSHIR